MWWLWTVIFSSHRPGTGRGPKNPNSKGCSKLSKVARICAQALASITIDTSSNYNHSHDPLLPSYHTIACAPSVSVLPNPSDANRTRGSR
jgi:hypothetical protein